MNLKPLVYTSFYLILAGAVWISGCARPLNPVNPIPLKPATSTPTVSGMPSATLTATASVTSTPSTLRHQQIFGSRQLRRQL